MTATSLDPPADELLTVAIAGTPRHMRIVATGEVDSSSAPLLREYVESVLDGDATEVTIDLGGVTFLDSAGLCVLAAGHRQAVRQNVRLRVQASSRAVIRPLQITGLWQLLQVEQVDPATSVEVPTRGAGSVA